MYGISYLVNIEALGRKSSHPSSIDRIQSVPSTIGAAVLRRLRICAKNLLKDLKENDTIKKKGTPSTVGITKSNDGGLAFCVSIVNSKPIISIFLIGSSDETATFLNQ